MFFNFIPATERDRKVMLEANLLEHDHLIKSCIQLTSADVDRAVDLMNSYKRKVFLAFVCLSSFYSIFLTRLQK